MPYINNLVFDSGLSYASTNGTRMDICSSEPTTYAAMTSASLGNKTGVSTAAPSNGSPSGRRVVVAAVTGGAVTGTGTATHWALSNGSNVLIASGPLAASQAVTSGNTFSLDTTTITITGAV